MRFALSAAAAASGLVLFAAAFFGQPEVYLRHARQQWDAWVDFEPSRAANQDEGPQAVVLAARVQALQDEVDQLKDQLAAKQAAAEVAQATPPAPTPPTPAPAAPAPAAKPSQTPQAAQASAMPEASVTAPVTVPERRAVTAPTERRDAAGKQAGVAQSKSSPVRPDPVRSEAARSEPVRSEPDDTRSVLARLRQAPAAPTPAPAPVIDPPVERPKPVASPAVSRMVAAQAAFSSGRVEDARRLLQEAQLLLVFRPTGSSNEDASAAGRGSVNVAHALEALGSSDIVHCRVFLDRAIDDMAGTGTDVPDHEVWGRRTGYAPAYPPR